MVIMSNQSYERIQKYEVGQSVKIVSNQTADSQKHDGKVGVITKATKSTWEEHSQHRKDCGDFYYTIDAGQGEEYEINCWETDIKLINSNNNKTMLKTIGVMMKKLLDADTQKLVKAGFINGDLELTSDGMKALTAVLFDANKAALVAEADIVIAEDAAKNK